MLIILSGMLQFQGPELSHRANHTCMYRARFLGYAGLPLLESIPCCFLAIFALIRIARIHRIHERLSRDVAIGYTFDVTTFSVRLSTASKHEPDDTLYPNPSPHFSSSSSPRAVTSSRPPSTIPGPSAVVATALLSPCSHFRNEASARQFHLPFRTTDESESQGSLVSPNSLPQDVHVRVDSHASSALPASIPLDHADDNDDLRRASPYIVSENRDMESDATHEDLNSFDDRVSSVVFNRDPSLKSELDIERGIKEQEYHRSHEDPRYASQYYPSHVISWLFDVFPVCSFTGTIIPTGTSPSKTLRQYLASSTVSAVSHLPYLTWHHLILNCLIDRGFWIVQALMILSTLICVIRNRPPMAFGTEHVAALLSAWGPFIIFSHQDGVRKQLIFWRRPVTTP